MHLPLTLRSAVTLYHELEDLLSQACEQITVAGSVRRNYAHHCRADNAERIVKDIEIVCQPKFVRDGRGLFAVHSALDMALAELRAKGIVADDPDNKKNGDRYKRLVFRGLAVIDLFVVLPPAQWGAILAIRTGDAQFSQLLVTPRRQGGAMPTGFRMHSGGICCETDHQGTSRDACTEACRVVTPTEQSFFAALDLPYPELDRRTARDLQGFLVAAQRGGRKSITEERKPHASTIAQTR